MHASAIVATGTVHMAMIEVVGTGIAYRNHFDRKAQRIASQPVVAGDDVLDPGSGDVDLASLSTPLELHARLNVSHSGKRVLRHFLDELWWVHSTSLFHDHVATNRSPAVRPTICFYKPGTIWPAPCRQVSGSRPSDVSITWLASYVTV